MATGGGVAFKAGAVMQGAGGRIVAGLGLTEKQEAFCIAFCNNGEHATQAATEAGYASPATEGWRLLQLDHVAAQITRIQRRGATRLRGLAVRILERVGMDRATPPDAAIRAAIELERIGDKWAGDAIPDGKADGARVRPPGQQSANVAQILAELRGGQSVTLRSDPPPSTLDAQPIEYTTVNE